MYESMIAQSMLTTISAEISKTKGHRQNCRKVIFSYDVVGGSYNIRSLIASRETCTNEAVVLLI